MKTVARAGLLLLSWSATAYGQSAPPPTALSAALQAQATLCTSTDGSVTKDQIISACTALLGAKELNATERATSLLFRGTARSTGDPAAARKDFEAGLAIADADKSIRANLLGARGQLRETAKDAVGARVDYEASLALDPTVEVTQRRGWLNLNERKYDAAYKDFTTVIGVSGLNTAYLSEMYRLRAAALTGRDDATGALADLEQAVAKDPANAAARYARAQAYERTGKYEAALLDMDAAVKAAPTWGDAANGACWVRVAYLKRDFDRARVLCDAAQKALPGDANIMDSVGLVALQQKRWQDAWNAYDAALKARPRFASAQFGRGIAAVRLGRAAESSADIVAAITIDPGIAQKYSAYGQTL